MAKTRTFFTQLSVIAAVSLAHVPAVFADAPPIDPDALKRLVHQDCGSCHGLTLKGGLGPDIRPETLTHFDAETLEMMILDGIPDTAMPPWRPLITQEEARWIADYLLTGDAP